MTADELIDGWQAAWSAMGPASPRRHQVQEHLAFLDAELRPGAATFVQRRRG